MDNPLSITADRGATGWEHGTLSGHKFHATSVKLSYELGKITFSTGKPKLTPGEVSTFQGF